MNGLSLAASTSSNSPVPPPNPTSDASHSSLHTTRPEFSTFKFKNIGQPPTLLSRFSDVSIAAGHRLSSPDRNDVDMDMASPEDHPMIGSDEHRTPQPTPRRSLWDMLAGNADPGQNQRTTVTQIQESVTTSPPSTSPTMPGFPRLESRRSSIARQLPGTADVPRADHTSSRTSVPPEIHAHDHPDSDMVDLYADPDSRSRSPFSLFSDLSEVVRESADLDRITTLHRVLATEREELLRRHEETTRALSRAKSQLDHVLSLTDEAIQTTAVFVGKEKARLETKKTKAEAKIEHKKNLEAEQRRKAKELERKAQIEMEQQAERQRLEEQRKKEEALAAERQRLEEIQAKESAQAEERRRFEEERSRIEEEERHRLAEEDRRRRDEEERKRQAEEQKTEEERLRGKLAERETAARKQEEDRRTQLLERRRLAEDERRRKEAEAAATKAEAEKAAAAEKEQQRIFQERRATVLKDKYKNYNRPEPGLPPTGPPPSLEGLQSSNLPAIPFNDLPRNPQVAEHQSGLAKANRIRDTPTFVPAATEAGRLPPDLSRQVVLDSGAVKHETTSPVIAPVDNVEVTEGTPPTPLPSRPLSSMSTTAPAPASATLPSAPHLPAKPVTIYSQPPRPRVPPRRTRSMSRSPSRSPRRGSPISRLPSRSPEPSRGRYPSPIRNLGFDHYSPPHHSSRYDSRSASPPPPNMRKRAFQDPWDRADTPSKLDYSHPAKRRAASPLRSRSPPSPRPRPLTQPPHVISTRRPPPINRRGRGGPLPLEQRLSSRPQHLAERIR